MEMRPLPRSFMLVSMLGLAISLVYTYSGRLDATWGFTLILISGIMFVASVFSMTPPAEELHPPLEKPAKSTKKAPKKVSNKRRGRK